MYINLKDVELFFLFWMVGYFLVLWKIDDDFLDWLCLEKKYFKDVRNDLS